MINPYEQVRMRLDVNPAKYVVQVPWTNFACSASGFDFGGQIYF